MEIQQNQGLSLSLVAIALLKGVVYAENDPPLWQDLLTLRPRVLEYMQVLGLELTVDEAEGHAFLRTRAVEGEVELPRLIARRQLSFPVSLLLALLRKRLAESDVGGGDNRLILTRDDVVEWLRVFQPGGSNEAKLVDQVSAHLNKIEEFGFIRRLKGQENVFEVRRILKTFVDAQWLSEFDAKLAAYREHVLGDAAKEVAS